MQILDKVKQYWTCAKSNPKTVILCIVALAVAHEVYHWLW